MAAADERRGPGGDGSAPGAVDLRACGGPARLGARPGPGAKQPLPGAKDQSGLWSECTGLPQSGEAQAVSARALLQQMRRHFPAQASHSLIPLLGHRLHLEHRILPPQSPAREQLGSLGRALSPSGCAAPRPWLCGRAGSFFPGGGPGSEVARLPSCWGLSKPGPECGLQNGDCWLRAGHADRVLL